MLFNSYNYALYIIQGFEVFSQIMLTTTNNLFFFEMFEYVAYLLDHKIS